MSARREMKAPREPGGVAPAHRVAATSAVAFLTLALGVILGRSLGWYGEPVAGALLVLVGLLTGPGSILAAARWRLLAPGDGSEEGAESEPPRERERRVRANLERVTRSASSIDEAVADLPEPDISAVLHVIALEAQILTGARYVAVGLGTDRDRPFDPWVALGVSGEVAQKIGRHPRPVGTLGRVARTGLKIRVADVRQDPAFRGFPPGHPPMRSLLGVPIRYRGRSVGNLYLADKEGAAEFNAEDERLVEMLAGRAAVAIETASLYIGEAAQRNWLRNVVDQLPDGVIILDKRGHALLTNRSSHRFILNMVGTHEVWGNPDVLDPRTFEGEAVPFSELPPTRALEDGEASTSQELALRTREGGMVAVLISAAPLRDEAGAITGATVVIKDVSALRELERLREEWTSLIAHDLRQPVATMALSIESLSRWCRRQVGTPQRREPPGEREERAIGRIQSGLRRMTRMIDDLLDTTQIEAKRLSISPSSVDVAPFLEDVAELARESINGPPIHVDSEADLRAWVDPQRIQQAMTNLLSNAVKYGDRTSRITISAHRRGEGVEIAVSNRGPGIPADELPILFTRFGRSHRAWAEGLPGTGLGLYIAKGIIEAHRGRIWAESSPGEVTAFRFVVPLAGTPAHPRPDLTAGASP